MSRGGEGEVEGEGVGRAFEARTVKGENFIYDERALGRKGRGKESGEV